MLADNFRGFYGNRMMEWFDGISSSSTNKYRLYSFRNALSLAIPFASTDFILLHDPVPIFFILYGLHTSSNNFEPILHLNTLRTRCGAFPKLCYHPKLQAMRFPPDTLDIRVFYLSIDNTWPDNLCHVFQRGSKGVWP